MQSFKDYAHKFTMLKSISFALIVTLIITMITIFLGALFLKTDTSSRMTAVKDNFTYWTQVGDSFQIIKTIKNNEKAYKNTAYIIRTQDGTIFKSGNTNSMILTKGIVFHDLELFYTIEDLMLNDGQALGTIRITRRIPIYLLIPVVVGIFIIVSLLSLFNLRGVSSLSNILTTPLKELSDEIESYSESQELKAIETNAKIFEVSHIRKKLVELAQRISTQEQIIKEKEKSEALNELARQVAHDIRSPIAALAAAVADEKKLEGSGELVKLAAERLMNISEDLLTNSRKREEELTEISDIVEAIILEKKATSKNIEFEIQNSVPNGKVKIEKSNISRILSNILNNSIESYDNKLGKVMINITQAGRSIVLEIKDNGKGIPQDILKKILSEHISYGKKQGNGLGIKHALSTIKEANGKLDMISSLGNGTTTVISLPAL